MLFGFLVAIFVRILSFVSFFIPRRWFYSFWTRQKIPQMNPWFPFGDIWQTVKQRRSYAQRTADLYNQAVRKGLRFVGIYVFCQPVLLITDADLVRRILRDDFTHFHDRGAHVNERHDPLSAHLFSLAGDKWRDMRRMLSPAFAIGKMREMFPAMNVCGQRLWKVIERDLGKPINIRDLMTRYTMDVIASVGFGKQFNSLENPDEEFRRLGMKFFSRSWKTSARMLLAFVAPSLNRYLQLKLVDDDVEKYMLKLVREGIACRENGGRVKRDFLQMLVQLRNQGEIPDRSWEVANTATQEKSLTVEEIAAQEFVFLNAAYETTSSTIAFCMYELCRNRDYLTRVVREIDDALALEGSEISYDALGRMAFLENCIEETTRKYPISPILFRVCTEPYKIPGTETVIEKGTLVHISLLGLHYDARHFVEPFKFNPDRFAERDPTQYPYYAFGAGERQCNAQRMGMLMIKMALVELLFKYDFALNSPLKAGEIDLDPSLLMLQPKRNIMLIPTKRVGKVR